MKLLKHLLVGFCLTLIVLFIAAYYEASGSKPDAKKAPDNWSYFKNTDSFTNKTSYYACTLSLNIIRGYGRLCFRKMGGRFDGYFEVKGGIIHCHVDGCAMRFRFDDGPIQTKHVRESSDPTDNIVFFSDPSPMMKAAKDSKRLRISVDLYRSGPLNFEFDPHGFDLDKMLKQ